MSSTLAGATTGGLLSAVYRKYKLLDSLENAERGNECIYR